MRTTHLVGGAPCGHARVTGRGADDLVEARVVDELGRQVARWVEAGVIRRDQADAILAMEGGGAEPAGRRAVAVEILGYVGGVLALVAGIVLGAETWAQIGRWGRVAVLGAGVAALVGAGWRLRADGRVLPRLASVLWFAAVAAWAGLLAVLLGGRSDEALGNPPLLVASGSLALAVVLWALERRTLQQVALLVTAVATVVAAGDGLGWAGETVAGLGLLGVGAAWLALGRRHLLQPRRTAEALGAIAVASGPEVLFAAGSEAWLWVGLAVALGLLVAEPRRAPGPPAGRPRAGRCRRPAPGNRSVDDRGEGVHDAPAVDAVARERPLAGGVKGRVEVRVGEDRRRRARRLLGRPGQHPLDGLRVQGEPAVARVAVAVAADDQRGDPRGVRRRHRGALQVAVVGAGPVLAVPQHERGGRVAVGVDLAAGLQDAQREGGQHPVLQRQVLVGAEEVTGEPARRREVGLLDAPVGVVGLLVARAERGDRDDPAGLGGDGDAGVVDVAVVGGTRREVGAGVVDGRVADVGVLVAEGGDRRDPVVAREVARPLR